jgi:siroheme synthase
MCVTGTLQDIVEKVKRENLKPPSVVVVGEVVRLQEYLRWFGNISFCDALRKNRD